MNRKNQGLAAIIGLAALSFGTGCTDNQQTLFIRQVPVPDPEDQCSVTADPSAPALFSGRLDATLATTYQQFFLVGNQMIARGDAQRLLPETSRVQFYEADVQIFVSDVLVDEFTVPVSGFADEAAETTPSYGLVAVNPVLTSSTVDGVLTVNGPQGTFVVARIVVRGTTLGGVDVATGIYDFPIFVCGDRANKGPCITMSRPTSCEDDLNLACLRGQDIPHDCREVQAAVGGSFCQDSSGTDCQ
ncbi:MAG: hypothetical protein FJ095_00865 [Deltaproteobacteria bacterium]|nr:hypothetical protein [Deltaproteobacteria bacterium]